jgi:hypothetical protein
MEKGDGLEVNLFSGDNSTAGQPFDYTCNGGASEHSGINGSQTGGVFFDGECASTVNGDYPVVATF